MNVVFDIDGTICHDGRRIDQTLLNYFSKEIAENSDHRLIFASARPVRDILPLLPANLQRSYLIGGNGTMVYFEKEPLYTKPLPSAAASEIINYIVKHKLDYMIDEAWNYAFAGENLQELKKKIDILGRAKNLSLQDIKSPLKILIANYQNETQVIKDLSHLAIEPILYPRENCLDLLSQGVNKASALTEIFGAEPYLAFGNDRNDLEMLRQASYSVCVGDSLEVQNVAHKTISENTAEMLALLKELIH